MQVPDIATAVSPEKLPMPYVYKGLSVQGVSPYRLTPVANPNIKLTPEFREQLARKNLVRLFIESKTAIATVGRGLRPAAPTVRAHVRVVLITSGLVQRAVSLQARELLTQKAAPLSELCSEGCGIAKADCRASAKLCCPDCKCRFESDGEASAGYDATVTPKFNYVSMVDDEPVVEDLSDLNEDMDVEF